MVNVKFHYYNWVFFLPEFVFWCLWHLLVGWWMYSSKSNSARCQSTNFHPFPWKISWINNNLHLVWKYALIFVYRHCLDQFSEPNSFPKAWLREKYEPWGEDNVQGHVCKHMVLCKSNVSEICKFPFLFLWIFIEKWHKNMRENSINNVLFPVSMRNLATYRAEVCQCIKQN